MNPKRIKVIPEWPTPPSIRKIWGFHDLTKFYKRFVPYFSIHVTPLIKLVRNHVPSREDALLNKRGREVVATLTFDQVYMQVLNKVIKDTQRKANTHIVLKFDRYDTQFLVQETINRRKVQPGGNFTIKLDERCSEYGKSQKLYMPCSYVIVACKHAYHEYKNYIHLVYMLKNVSNIYKALFGKLCNKAY